MRPARLATGVIRLAWYAHRGLYRVVGGRLGLWRPHANGCGALRLTITGRRRTPTRHATVCSSGC
ncbi:hypothetical protein KJK32_17015 [Streptomyces sp. JCM17656]|nr:hypothetical protein KJK32_17015 [Streptomyces sp. JCM17656]